MIMKDDTYGVVYVPSFDIESLADFTPPKYRCINCRALWLHGLPWIRGLTPIGGYKCSICHVAYDYDPEMAAGTIEECMDADSCLIKIPDLLAHARDLGQIARRRAYAESESRASRYPYLKALLQSFSLAKSFIHFVSTGYSPFMDGALKLAAQRVAVNGVVSGSSGSIANMLTTDVDNWVEAFQFELRPIVMERDLDIPHQKLVVIDGLLAFKGSANLYESAWRKAERGQEQIEIVTDVAEVLELNNSLFSPAWLQGAKDKRDSITLTIESPPWLDHELSG